MQPMFAAPILLMGLLLASCQKSPTTKNGNTHIAAEVLKSEANATTYIRGEIYFPEATEGLQSYGICWSETESPTVDGNKRDFTPPANQQGWLRLIQPFRAGMDGLISGKEYSARVYAEQGGRIVYGEPVKFSVADPQEETALKIFEIPIIFHTLYERASDPIQNPKTSLFFDRVEKVNKAFRQNMLSANSSVSVRFRLAESRPDGTRLPEAGIERVYYPGSVGLLPLKLWEVPLDERRQALMWDPYRYLNIWLFKNDKVSWSGTACIAYVPEAYVLPGTWPADYYLEYMSQGMHGICLNSQYFSDNSNQMTLAHEIGHALGLFHTFSAYTSDDCEDTDFCDDTPSYDRNAYEANSSRWMYERQACDGTIFTADNIMDYWHTHETTFTPQQCQRIEHILRYGLALPDRPAEILEFVKNTPTKGTATLPPPPYHIDWLPTTE